MLFKGKGQGTKGKRKFKNKKTPYQGCSNIQVTTTKTGYCIAFSF